MSLFVLCCHLMMSWSIFLCIVLLLSHCDESFSRHSCLLVTRNKIYIRDFLSSSFRGYNAAYPFELKIWDERIKSQANNKFNLFPTWSAPDLKQNLALTPMAAKNESFRYCAIYGASLSRNRYNRATKKSHFKVCPLNDQLYNRPGALCDSKGEKKKIPHESKLLGKQEKNHDYLQGAFFLCFPSFWSNAEVLVPFPEN